MKNLVILIGNTGDNVKMHHFEGGGCVGRFPLATSYSYTNKQTNEKVSETEWHNITVRNKQAEVCEKYVKKGDKLYIEGRLKTRKWQDDKGQDRYSTEIICTSFIFLTPKGGSSGAPSGTSGTPQGQEHAGDQFLTQKPAVDPTSGDDDDLPF